jgi:hypothetical protein
LCSRIITLNLENKIQSFLFKIDFEKTFDKVNKDFLIEILEGRDFGVMWVVAELVSISIENWINTLVVRED